MRQDTGLQSTPKPSCTTGSYCKHPYCHLHWCHNPGGCPHLQVKGGMVPNPSQEHLRRSKVILTWLPPLTGAALQADVWFTENIAVQVCISPACSLRHSHMTSLAHCAAPGMECEPGSTLLHCPGSMLCNTGTSCVPQSQEETALVCGGLTSVLSLPQPSLQQRSCECAAMVDRFMQVQTQEGHCSFKWRRAWCSGMVLCFACFLWRQCEVLQT